MVLWRPDRLPHEREAVELAQQRPEVEDADFGAAKKLGVGLASGVLQGQAVGGLLIV